MSFLLNSTRTHKSDFNVNVGKTFSLSHIDEVNACDISNSVLNLQKMPSHKFKNLLTYQIALKRNSMNRMSFIFSKEGLFG